MKTVLILVSLVVLSSLSIYAQKDNIAENLLASAILHNDPPATQDREQSLSQFLDQQLRNSTLWTDQQELNTSLAKADQIALRWSNTVENKTSYKSPYIPMLLEEMDHSTDFHQQLLAKQVPEPAHEPNLENLHGMTNSDFLKGGGLKWVIVE